MGLNPKILGIDPGFSGGLALLDTEKNTVCFTDAPVFKISGSGRHDYDIPTLLKILKAFAADFCVLEQSFAMPGQGVTSMFSIGKGFGMYLGLLTALEIPFTVVHPKKWQKVCGVIGGKVGGKHSHAYTVAYRLYPHAAKDLVTQRGRIIDGRVDALLLAEYGRATMSL